ncbi:hypothetical protein LR066_04070, partial [candidate division WOR-3 bacterium]|nr:hypothetical protein [candidate division WOR-3 bacterium]
MGRERASGTVGQGDREVEDVDLIIGDERLKMDKGKSTHILLDPGSGNVGIGTAVTPTEKLDIDGRIRIRGGHPATDEVLTTNATGVGSWRNPAALVDSSRWELYGVVLRPKGQFGLAMRGNVLHGIHDSTNVNFGVACTINLTGFSWKYITISGGLRNIAMRDGATVSGGSHNRARGDYSVVSGGGGPNEADSNAALGNFSTVGGGRACIASGDNATVGGGWNNVASNVSATVGGGHNNTASGNCATVGGGRTNTASALETTVGGGENNRATEQEATVGGGQSNTASGLQSTVAGGEANFASNQWATVAGGRGHTAGGIASTVGGGHSNIASGDYATIGGGRSNQAAGSYSTVSGGSTNQAIDPGATISGGRDQWATAPYATVAGGAMVRVNGKASFGFGFGGGDPADQVFVADSFDIVFGDGGFRDYEFGINQESPAHPLHVGTDTTDGNGAHLTIGGNWMIGSSREFKENFQELNGADILNKVKEMSVTRWQYKGSDSYHIGPVSEDFHNAFGVSE